MIDESLFEAEEKMEKAVEVAKERFAGIRTSRRRALRLMREHGLLAHQRADAHTARAPTTARSQPGGSILCGITI